MDTQHLPIPRDGRVRHLQFATGIYETTRGLETIRIVLRDTAPRFLLRDRRRRRGVCQLTGEKDKRGTGQGHDSFANFDVPRCRSKVRKVGRAGVVVQTTSDEAADKIRKAVPPTLRVTEPRSRRPLVALRNLSGDPSGEAVISGLYEQNLRTRHPEWTIERIKKSCRVAFKKSRRERATTTVVLECEPELRDVLVSLDRAYIGWEAVPICDYIDVTCCRKCQQYGH
ncbi:hypothetical protein EVAR_38043_1 [Eumeta japonica]|uniref:Uncharacterized protein n=1 Tax=Eumeta variegata TaxID=151549 RepID=A0A4C1W9T2_EUMVA|nr:hypothetical protein EVAR_38043_1 [Eumeta japonica]